MSRVARSMPLSVAVLALFCLAPFPVLAVTLDFEDLTLGTTYNFGAFFTTNGVAIDVEAFQSSGGGFVANFAQVDGSQNAGGSGNDLEVNNVILDFGLPPGITSISFLFGEFGGNLNLNINGDFRNFENFQDIDSLSIGGVSVDVVSGGFGNDQGRIEFGGGNRLALQAGWSGTLDRRHQRDPGARYTAAHAVGPIGSRSLRRRSGLADRAAAKGSCIAG